MAQENKNERLIEQLRASKNEAERDAHCRGEIAGTQFVCGYTDWAALERLKSAVEAIFGEPRSSLEDYGVYDIARILDGDTGKYKSDLPQDLLKTYGEAVNSSEFVRGFVDGALAKFEELKKQLG